MSPRRLPHPSNRHNPVRASGLRTNRPASDQPYPCGAGWASVTGRKGRIAEFSPPALPQAWGSALVRGDVTSKRSPRHTPLPASPQVLNARPGPRRPMRSGCETWMWNRVCLPSRSCRRCAARAQSGQRYRSMGSMSWSPGSVCGWPARTWRQLEAGYIRLTPSGSCGGRPTAPTLTQIGPGAATPSCWFVTNSVTRTSPRSLPHCPCSADTALSRHAPAGPALPVQGTSQKSRGAAQRADREGGARASR